MLRQRYVQPPLADFVVRCPSRANNPTRRGSPMRRTAWFVPLVPLALAACTADQKEVAAPAAVSTRAAQSASAANSGRYIVASNSGFKGDLAATVAALGGSIESIHEGAGIAVVTGLTDEAAAKLNGQGGINDIQADAEI